MLMANKNLQAARASKNDEFYTQYHDIELEMTAYLEYDPDVFRGKTVLLPCDDQEWSNFTRYFAAKFDELGIKKLISTSYAPESKKYCSVESQLERDSPKFDAEKSKAQSRPVKARESDNRWRAYYRVADENIAVSPLMVRAWQRQSDASGTRYS